MARFLKDLALYSDKHLVVMHPTDEQMLLPLL